MNNIVTGKNTLKIQTRLFNGDEIAFGPGKAELLLAIAETGSISAAARKMNMSYRRAWLLVDTMNRCFKSPLVSSVAGGNLGGGACLTTTGKEVLSRYQALQNDIEEVAAAHFTSLREHLAK